MTFIVVSVALRNLFPIAFRTFGYIHRVVCDIGVSVISRGNGDIVKLLRFFGVYNKLVRGFGRNLCGCRFALITGVHKRSRLVVDEVVPHIVVVGYLYSFARPTRNFIAVFVIRFGRKNVLNALFVVSETRAFRSRRFVVVNTAVNFRRSFNNLPFALVRADHGELYFVFLRDHKFRLEHKRFNLLTEREIGVENLFGRNRICIIFLVLILYTQHGRTAAARIYV